MCPIFFELFCAGGKSRSALSLAGFAQAVVVQVSGPVGMLLVEAFDRINVFGVHRNDHGGAYPFRL